MSTQNPVSSDDISLPATPPVPAVVDTGAARLPAEKRDVYERIRSRRAQMSPVTFTLVTAVREMREHG